MDRREQQRRFREARRRNAWREMWELRHAMAGRAYGFGVPQRVLTLDSGAPILLTTTGVWTPTSTGWRGLALWGHRSYAVHRTPAGREHRGWIARGQRTGFRTDTAHARPGAASQQMDISVRTALYRVRMIELSSGRQVPLGASDQEIVSIAMEPQERHVAWVCRNAAFSPNGYAIQVLDMATEHELILRDAVPEVCGLGFLEADALLICYEDALELVDITTGMVRQRWSWGAEYIAHALWVEPITRRCAVSVSMEWDLSLRQCWTLDVASGETNVLEDDEAWPEFVTEAPGEAEPSRLSSHVLGRIESHYVSEDRHRDRVLRWTRPKGQPMQAEAEGDDLIGFVADPERGWLVCVRAFDYGERARASAPWHGRHLFKASVWSLHTQAPLGFLGAWTSNTRHPVALDLDAGRMRVPVTHSNTEISRLVLLDFMWDPANPFETPDLPMGEVLEGWGPEGVAPGVVRWSGDGRALWLSNFGSDTQAPPRVGVLGESPQPISGLDPSAYQVDCVAGDETGRLWVFSRGSRLYTYDATSRSLRSWTMTGDVGCVAIHPSGQSLAAGLDDGTVWLCTHGEPSTLQLPGSGPVACLSFGAEQEALLWVVRGGVVTGLRDGDTIFSETLALPEDASVAQLECLGSGSLLVGLHKGPVLEVRTS